MASIVSKGPTVTGNLVIATSVTGPLDLNGIWNITGNLSCEHSRITSLSGRTIGIIGGHMILKNLTRLALLDFPNLSMTEGISWSELTTLTEPTEFIELVVVPYIYIVNTFLDNIGKINPANVSHITIASNSRLLEVKLDLKSIEGNITIADNNRLRIVDLGKAKKATYVQLRGIFTE